MDDGEIKNAKEIAELEAKIFTATTDKQTQLLNQMLRPTESILSDIETAGVKLKEVKGKVVLNADALKAAGIKNSNDLAKKMGISYKGATKDQQKKLDRMIRLAERGELTRDAIDDFHTDLAKQNQEAMAAADNRSNKLLPWYKSLYNTAKGTAADLGALGPIMTGMLGLGGVIAGVGLLYHGQRANSLMVVNMMKQSNGPIFKQVKHALLDVKGTGGGDGSGGDIDYEGKGKKGKGKGKSKSKSKGRVTKWKKGFTKRLNKTAGGRWASKAAGSIGKRGRSLLKSGSSLGKGLLKGGLKHAPLIGTLLLSGGLALKDLYDTYKETGKVSGKDVAKTGGGMLGGMGGAALGAAVGTLLLPGIGTAIGAALGGWAGEEAGQWVAGKAADAITSPTEKPVEETGATLAKNQDVNVGQLAEAGAGSVTGKPSLMPEPAPMPAGSSRRLTAAMGTSGGSSLESNLSPGSITPDGALTLKVRGMYDIFSQYMKDRSASA